MQGASAASSRHRSMEATAASEGTSQPPWLTPPLVIGPHTAFWVPDISPLHQLQHCKDHAGMPAQICGQRFRDLRST